MAPAANDRLELAKLCSGRNWSKAIRVLDSILAESSSVQDICNRAFCYSRLELHKHVIKDCDKALQLNPNALQAYILKGNALSALGRKEEALRVWEEGYQNAVCDSTDLKQLLELEELLTGTRESRLFAGEDHSMDASSCETKVVVSEDHIMDSSSTNVSTTETEAIICEDHGSSSVTKVVISEDHVTDSRIKKSSTTNAEHTTNSSGVTPSDKESVDGRRLENTQEICSNPVDGTEIFSMDNDTAKMGRKVVVTGIPRTKSISLDLRLSRGISQVNEGNYDQAVSIFDQILRETPEYPEALIGRGTAYAFQRELDAAIADFTMAIQSKPLAGEAWKRRGQARAALGEFKEASLFIIFLAIEDLTKALEFEPNSPDVLHERGIVNFKFKDYHSAVDDLSRCIKRAKKNKSAYTYLGLALSAIGEYGQAEEAHLKSLHLDQCFLDAWAHLAQFYLDLTNSEKALHCLEKVLLVNGRFAKAYYLRGLLYHGLGQHRIAIKDLSLGLSIENSNVECLYLRASCYHAIGEYGDAVKDYDAVLDLEHDSMDKFVLQCLAFYQAIIKVSWSVVQGSRYLWHLSYQTVLGTVHACKKELALYTASKVNSEFCWFDIDGDIDPLFKEYWCKRLHPQYVCERVYRQPPLKESLKKGRLKKQDFVVTKHKQILLHVADVIGQKIQYDCPGFTRNKRQYRMAGLAAIELAQKVAKYWRFLRNATKNGKKTRKKERLNIVSQNRGGACCTTSGLSETSSYGSNEDKYASGRSLSWQDVYSVAVKWRQISEPCDPVVWVNKLSEEFNSGFGSHTPMLLGQAKVVRYYPNYQRTFDVAKSIIKDIKYVNNAADKIVDLSGSGKLQKIIHAGSCSDMYDVIGENFWVGTTCESTAFEGKHLEGTRITLQRMDKIGFDFAIRTPCTPSRWDEYTEEMATAWEAICSAYTSEMYPSNDLTMLENVKDAILRMTYYWYNFMPLSRGSAVVGYIVLLGLFLAANMEVTGSIPPGVQVDWEAILSPNPDAFLSSIKPWLYPSVRINTAWKDYPDITLAFATTGSIIAALSSYDA
ncbi:Tetratricopeptide repeat protein [Musa troglodytarum]|uniref:Tetratricopeptide repeat protein n=1 Tax=Musa troglodytarum TaxID=320322 RepID=A0A9E7K1K9_9LILI|nr:Tetratricopeptide repeat protein [Musa troglodytarum]